MPARPSGASNWTILLRSQAPSLCPPHSSGMPSVVYACVNPHVQRDTCIFPCMLEWVIRAGHTAKGWGCPDGNQRGVKAQVLSSSTKKVTDIQAWCGNATALPG